MTMVERLQAAALVTDAATPDLEGVPGVDFLPAMAAETASEYPVMPKRCADCAFCPGTDANLTPTTFMAARECVDRSHPFYCHKGEDSMGFKTHLCAGWATGIIARAALAEAKTK